MYCVTGRPNNIPPQELFAHDYTISSNEPIGDFCEGYEGAKNGLYYEIFDESQELYPRIYDLSKGDATEESLYLSENISYDYLAMVTIISEEYFNRNLYFFKEQNKWYLWVEDYCDCSA